ncbi:MAG: hypothetical protein WCY19_05490 [Candidatus Gastranaerophilaceae bacterium]
MSSQRVSEFMSRKLCEQKITQNQFTNIVAYPQNDARELARIMTDIRIECLPVLFSPWNRKLIGFIELNKIKVFLND